MSFGRHGQSFGPMWFGFGKAWAGVPPPVGRARPSLCQAATEGTPPAFIVHDELHRLFLGGVLSSRARLRFAGCLQSAMNVWCGPREIHRTANSWLTECLSPGVHFTSLA
jgi:hypothetical protein